MIVAKNSIVKVGKICQLLVVMILMIFRYFSEVGRSWTKFVVLFCAHIEDVIHSNMFIPLFLVGVVSWPHRRSLGNSRHLSISECNCPGTWFAFWQTVSKLTYLEHGMVSSSFQVLLEDFFFHPTPLEGLCWSNSFSLNALTYLKKPVGLRATGKVGSYCSSFATICFCNHQQPSASRH